jgi:glycine betaine/proline transport system ATP-binding protein
MEAGRVVQYGSPQDIVLRPANEYVANFVAHMNPLNVLTGDVMMRKLEQVKRNGSAIIIDPLRQLTVKLSKSGAPETAELAGRPVSVFPSKADGERVPALSLAVMPAGSSMRSIIEARQTTGLPVLLAEGSQIIGVVGDEEIYSALMHRAQS